MAGSKEARAVGTEIRHAATVPSRNDDEEPVVAAVMIGVDPHKGSHTAVAIGEKEAPLGEVRVRA